MPEFEIRARCMHPNKCKKNMEWMEENNYRHVEQIETNEEFNAKDDADHFGIITAKNTQEAINLATQMQKSLGPELDRVYVIPCR